MPSSQITESPECSCTPHIPGGQILSYHTSAQVITLATCKKYRIVFKIILINFKAIHGLAPAYTRELISVRDTGRYDLRSNDGLLHLPRSAIDLSMRPPLNRGTIFRALSETPNL